MRQSENSFDLKKGANHPMARRRFITSCSLCAACVAVNPSAVIMPLVRESKPGRLKIRILYSLHAVVQPKPDWPNVGFDFRPFMEKINQMLASHFREMEFIPTLATGPEDAEKIVGLDKLQPVDGYIVYQMNCWNKVVQTIAGTGKPVLYADFQYGGSGGFLVYNSAFLNSDAQNTGFVASSRTGDLLDAVGCFNAIRKGGTCAEFVAAVTRSRLRNTPSQGRYKLQKDNPGLLSAGETIRLLKQSKILAVKDQQSFQAEPVMGIPLEYISFEEVNNAWSNADKEEAKAVAAKWNQNATDVTGVSIETLLTSAAMYLGMKSVLKAHDANAITINCLGGFYGGHIHAYPCLGFHELCNEGLVGGCECDVRSAATMRAFSTLSGGRPGFISDPVIDTAKRQIIYAHCVASNKVFGPGGPSNPFSIMTHSEDRQGASVRSILPVNYLTTTLMAHNGRKEILLHQAVATDNDPDDRACRTKLCAEPSGDIEKLFRQWQTWGWHRVTFYGDLKEPVEAFADAIGWKVVTEA